MLCCLLAVSEGTFKGLWGIPEIQTITGLVLATFTSKSRRYLDFLNCSALLASKLAAVMVGRQTFAVKMRE